MNDIMPEKKPGRTYTREVSPGRAVLLKGWVAQLRDLGGLKFFILRDREGIVQVTLKRGESPPALLAAAGRLNREDCVSVQGRARKSGQAPGGLEIVPERIEVISSSEPSLPIDIDGKIETGIDKRHDWRSLDLRSPRNLAIFKIQSKLVEGMQEWLIKNGYLQVFTPCLMGAASEGGADVFPVMYYDKEVFLRQDPQLHRQLLIAAGFDRIYDIGPSWRAEPSHTTRHLCEHRGVAVEAAFIRDEADTMRMEEGVVISALKRVAKDCMPELKILGKKVSIPDTPFPELRFPGIYDILERLGKKLELGDDIDREGEMLLFKHIKKKHNHEFFFINRFPFKKKPFYVMRFDDDPRWARSVDLVYRGVELSSGGQREHRYEKIMQQVKEKGMSPKGVEWFTKFFRYGVPMHGGFCLGIERLTQQLLDIRNIRDAVLFPRTPERFLP
jgi:nondiscriminating aspartyl-tRNA synthetase